MEDMKKISEFCYDYGYDYACAYFEDYEAGDFEDRMLLPLMGDYPDDFYVLIADEEYESGYEPWDKKSYYKGWEDCLKEATGKDYTLNCDGYRLVAVVGTKEEAEKYNEELWDKVDWSTIVKAGFHF